MKLPAVGELSDVTNTHLEQKADFEQLRGLIAQLLGAQPVATYTIDAGGAIKPTVGIFFVDTLGGAPTDDLDHLTGEDGDAVAGLPDGSLALFRCVTPTRAVTVRHAQGGAYDFELHGAASFLMNTTQKWLLVQRRGTRWYEILRSYGSEVSSARAFLGLTKASVIPDPANPGDDGKAILASGGNWIFGTPSSAGGPAERLLVSRITIDQTVGLADGLTYSQLQPNEITLESAGPGVLWDAGTFEVKVPAGISFVRCSLTLSIGFTVAPTAEWWAEAYVFHKPSGGAYPATPDSHTKAGLLFTSLQSHATADVTGEVNGQSGEVAVAAGDRLKVMLRAFAQGGGNTVKVRGASMPAYCWLSVEFYQ